MESIALRLKHSTFDSACLTLARELRKNAQKLRSLQYKTLVDACLLELGSSSCAETLFDAIESNWSLIESLSDRSHNALEFPWYQVGAALALINDTATSADAKYRARLVLGHLTAVLMSGGPKTRARMRGTLMDWLAPPSPRLRAKMRKAHDSGHDLTILASIMKGNAKVDLRIGDLCSWNGRLGIFIGLASKSKKVPTIAKAAGFDNDDESSESEDDEFADTTRLRDTNISDPSSFAGALRVLFVDDLKTGEVELDAVEVDLNNRQPAKISIILGLAIRTCSREALAFAGALLKDNLMPTSSILDECVEFLEADRVIDICGVFSSVGNEKLAEEVLVRHVLKSKRWVTSPALRFSMKLEESPPVVHEYITSFSSPLKKEMVVGALARAVVDGRTVEGIVRSFDNGMVTIAVKGTQPVSCRARICSFFFGNCNVFDLQAKGVDILANFEAITCLRGSSVTALEANSDISVDDVANVSAVEEKYHGFQVQKLAGPSANSVERSVVNGGPSLQVSSGSLSNRPQQYKEDRGDASANTIRLGNAGSLSGHISDILPPAKLPTSATSTPETCLSAHIPSTSASPVTKPFGLPFPAKSPTTIEASVKRAVNEHSSRVDDLKLAAKSTIADLNRKSSDSSLSISNRGSKATLSHPLTNNASHPGQSDGKSSTKQLSPASIRSASPASSQDRRTGPASMKRALNEELSSESKRQQSRIDVMAKSPDLVKEPTPIISSRPTHHVSSGLSKGTPLSVPVKYQQLSALFSDSKKKAAKTRSPDAILDLTTEFYRKPDQQAKTELKIEVNQDGKVVVIIDE